MMMCFPHSVTLPRPVACRLEHNLPDYRHLIPPLPAIALGGHSWLPDSEPSCSGYAVDRGQRILPVQPVKLSPPPPSACGGRAQMQWEQLVFFALWSLPVLGRQALNE